jgi:enoyl-CoA hydratase
MSLAEGLAFEASLFGLSFSTDDKNEGTAAFLGKRAPEFKGV